LIAVDATGRLGFAYNTERMARAGVDASGKEMVGY
jgi:isoaspartyl peptidase/L-asparaginase-like protein (Ntn-hydrolase superfamily)